jgi:hypothetical protein
MHRSGTGKNIHYPGNQSEMTSGTNYLSNSSKKTGKQPTRTSFPNSPFTTRENKIVLGPKQSGGLNSLILQQINMSNQGFKNPSRYADP